MDNAFETMMAECTEKACFEWRNGLVQRNRGDSAADVERGLDEETAGGWAEMRKYTKSVL
jgi:hypothetical protein